MPTPGKQWCHITCGTLNSWLPGDERGFRTRDHKLHSSGDHRNRPPEEEHEGLRRYWKGRAGEPIIIPKELRPVIGHVILKKLKALNHRVLVLSVSGMHVHILVELPRSRGAIKRDIGLCKRAASLAVTKHLPGRVWAKEPGIKPVGNRPHAARVYNYILEHEEEGAFVWTEREDEVE